MMLLLNYQMEKLKLKLVEKLFMKEAKLKFKPGNFEIISSGDYVICKVSGKKISLSELKYWNVELQEASFLTSKQTKDLNN